MKSTLSAKARSIKPVKSFVSTSRFLTFASSAVPALPGATKTSVTRPDRLNFHARACSLPPDPITSTLIDYFLARPSMTKMSRAGEDHCNFVFIRGFNDFFIPHGPSGLNNRNNSFLCSSVNAVSKWKKSI